jgi:hypothetical protein
LPWVFLSPERQRLDERNLRRGWYRCLERLAYGRSAFMTFGILSFHSSLNKERIPSSSRSRRVIAVFKRPWAPMGIYSLAGSVAGPISLMMRVGRIKPHPALTLGTRSWGS